MNYSVNKTYRFSNVRGRGDQYMDWFSIGNKTIANQGGIRVRSFWKKNIVKPPYNIPSLFILISNNHEKNKSNIPWEPAEFDKDKGLLIYKGDSRKYKKNSSTEDPRTKLEHMGNKQFKKIEDLLSEKNYYWLPPILYFSSVSMSFYAFKGLFIPKKISTYYDSNTQVEKDNYKLHCMRIPSTNIPLNWLKDRCQTKDIDTFDKNFAPQSWNKRSSYF